MNKMGLHRVKYLLLPMLLLTVTASTGTAQEARPEQAPQAPSASESHVSQGLLDTSGKVRLSLQGTLGFGFDKVDVGTTTKGDTVSISGGGGAGGSVGIAFGLSRSLDLDLDLGFQVSGLTPAVDNATGSFTRGFALATLKYKVPTSDSGQFKFGLGIGEYFGGKLDVDTTDALFGNHTIVEYDPAFGLHLTGEFERFIRPNLSINIGAKIYFVEYEAKTYKVNSVDVPLSSPSLSGDERNLNGSGMDLLLGINMYFN